MEPNNKDLINQLTKLNEQQEIEIESLEMEVHQLDTYCWTYFISLMISIGYIISTVYTIETQTLIKLVKEFINSIF